MKCKLYRLSTDARTLDKVDNSTQYKEYYTAVAPTKEVDIISPTFIFSYSVDVLTSNYLYCEEFARYYYITNAAVDVAGRIVVNCAVDVLQTYANDIRNSTGTILRTERTHKPTMYTDSKLPVYPCKNNVTSIVMQCNNSGMTGLVIPPMNAYVLTTIGGAMTTPTE